MYSLSLKTEDALIGVGLPVAATHWVQVHGAREELHVRTRRLGRKILIECYIPSFTHLVSTSFFHLHTRTHTHSVRCKTTFYAPSESPIPLKDVSPVSVVQSSELHL